MASSRIDFLSLPLIDLTLAGALFLISLPVWSQIGAPQTDSDIKVTVLLQLYTLE